MIDSSHAQGSSGLATALKDRPACVMPVQPNRSLPVLPAPHSPYRAIVSRRTSSVSDSGSTPSSQQLLQNVQGTFTNANSTGSLSSSSSSSTSTTSSLSPSSSPSPSPLLSSSGTFYGTPQKVRCTLDLEKIGMPNLKKNNELLRKPVINIIQESRSHEKSNQNISRRLGHKRKFDDGIENINTNTGYAPSRISAKDTINSYNFIDISKSPERYDVNVADSSGTVDPLSIYYTDSDAQKRESGPIKKRRKRKEKKPEEEEMKINGQKIVPPLRLKKIQSLQENVSEYQPNNEEERVIQIIERERQECMPKFRYYQPKPPEVPIVPEVHTRPTSKEHATNYRIVTGQTPPYDERIDSSTTPSKDQGLLSRKSNNHFKLEMNKKTDKQKLVSNSPTKFTKATLDSCVKQIKKLTNLLEMLPEVSPETAKDDSFGNNNNLQIIDTVKTNDLPNLNASPPCSTTFTDVLPSMNRSPSPEPPKLSPKIPVEFEATEERNSPPLLPRATSSNGENCEEDWEERVYHNQVDNNYHDTETEFNSSVNSSIITTTTGSIVTEQIDIDDKPEYLDLSTNVRKSKTYIDAVSDKINKELNRIEVDCDTEQVLKIDLRHSSSPENMVIDTTSLSKYEKESDAEYSPENRLRIDESEELQVQHKELVGGAGIKVVDNLTSAAVAARNIVAAAAITSSCDILNNQMGKSKSKVKDRRITESPKSNVIINEQQFPTLGNWLAKITTKLPNHQLSRPINEKNTRPNSVINVSNEVPAFNNYYHYHTQPQSQHQEAASPGLKHKNGLDVNSKSLNAEAQVKNQQWEPADQNQSQLLQNNSSNMSTSLLEAQLQQKTQQIDQLYPSVSMNRLIARSYPVDPYRHPLLRPTSQLPDPLSSTSMPYHSSTSPLLNPLSLSPNSPLSYWHQSIAKSHPESKRGFTDIPLNYDPLSLAKRSTYSQYHSLLPPVPINLMNPSYQIQPQQRQQQPQQHPSHYDRLWDKSGHCLRPPDSPIPTLNYSPWPNTLFPPESLLPGRSYLSSNWTSDPRNLLSTITPAMQNFASPYQPLSVPRVRNMKERPGQEQARNCETPHLGKVNYSPNTARTFQCSNCGSRGPVYKCLGCEAAYYCNETCQARHWNCHVTTCPKKMPKLKKVVP